MLSFMVRLGGPDLCEPCFDSTSRGLPLQTAGGSLTQGMKGSIPQPTAMPGGIVAKHFSADGQHLLFGSTAKFEPQGNESGADVTIYDRNLGAGTTQVVSTFPTEARSQTARGSRRSISRPTGPGWSWAGS